MSEGEHHYDGYESLEEEEQQMMVELREKFDIAEKKNMQGRWWWSREVEAESEEESESAL